MISKLEVLFYWNVIYVLNLNKFGYFKKRFWTL